MFHPTWVDPVLQWFDRRANGVEDAIAAAILLGAGALLRQYTGRVAGSLWYGAIALVTRRRYVLIWNDVDDRYSAAIALALEPKLPKLRIKVISVPEQLSFYPTGCSKLAAIVLIVTDVTKISEGKRDRERAQRRIKAYVRCGGGLVGTHDIIYRRVGNDILAPVFGGGKITHFETAPEVTYQVFPSHTSHFLRRDLPDTFALKDGEILKGHWDAEAETIFATSSSPALPLVVANHFHSGRSVWLNSGDKSAEGLCASIALPEAQFLQLLENSILWVSHR